MQEIKAIFDAEEKCITESASRILQLAKDFDKNFENLLNLKKYHLVTFEANTIASNKTSWINIYVDMLILEN